MYFCHALNYVVRSVPTLALVCALTISAANAQTFRVGYYVGDKHPLINPALTSFINEIKDKTNGKFEFRLFPAGQLFKPADAIKMLNAGVADIGMVVGQYHRQEFPLSQALSLPWDADPWTLTHMYLRATTEPGLIKDEWTKNGLVPLFTVTNAPYEIHTAGKPLTGLAAVDGMKIRSPGGAFDEIIKSLGAVPVAIPTPETFEAIQRGTIDASVYAFSNWSSLRLQEILKATTVNVKLPGPVGNSFGMSRRAFDTLSPQEQAIFLAAGWNATIKGQDAAAEENRNALERYKADGLKAFSWSDDDLKTLHQRLSALRKQWGKTIDASGRPGSKILVELDKLKATAEKAPRDLPTPPTSYPR